MFGVMENATVQFLEVFWEICINSNMKSSINGYVQAMNPETS